MTKTKEEIREEAEDVLIGEGGFQIARARYLIGELFKYLHSQGVVISHHGLGEAGLWIEPLIELKTEEEIEEFEDGKEP